MKKYSRTIPAWKRKYDEAYIAAGNQIPDGKTARAYNEEFGEQHKVPYGTVSSHYSKVVKEFAPADKGVEKPPKEYTGKKRGPKPHKLEWQEQIINDIESNNLPSMASVYCQQIALAFGVNDKTVKAYYYKHLADHKEKAAIAQVEPPIEPPVEPPVETPIQPPTTEQEEPKKPPLHPGYLYRKGSIIRVKVKHIESGYVLVDTLDEYKLTGMIHISNISNSFITDINKWFRYNMELNAQVIDYTEMDEGRLNLSTRNLPFTAMSWKYNKDKHKQQETLPHQEQLADIASKLFKTDIKTQEPIARPKNEGDEKDMELEWKQAKPFLESIIGTISQAAEVEMRKIMKESGVFAFTVALMGKKDNFTPDIGLMLAQAIREDLKIPVEKVLPR